MRQGRKMTLLAASMFVAAALFFVFAIRDAPVRQGQLAPQSEGTGGSFNADDAWLAKSRISPYEKLQSQSQHKSLAVHEQTSRTLESALVRASSISSDSAKSVLSSANFQENLRQFKLVTSSDPNSQDLTASYKEVLDKAIEEAGAPAYLEDIACGQTLCTGIVRFSNGGVTHIEALRSQLLGARTRHIYGFFDQPLQRDPFSIEYRFIFSNDPSKGGISFRGKH